MNTHLFKNILKILQPKKENFQIKNSDIFHISAQNIDCGYSLELPVYPCIPQFYYIKVGFKWGKLYRHVFMMANH